MQEEQKLFRSGQLQCVRIVGFDRHFLVFWKKFKKVEKQLIIFGWGAVISIIAKSSDHESIS
jgi:hypothetical protein